MGIFGKKTVEQIVAPITKIVDQLHNHADSSRRDAGYHADIAQTHKISAEVAEQEANKATSAAGKIAGLLK